MAAQLAQLRDDLLVRLWIASRSEVPADFPAEDQVKAAYEGNPQSFAMPTEYRVQQIFISAPDGQDAAGLSSALRKADDVSARLTGGDFAELARQVSEHAESASKGGDLGSIAENRLLPEIAAAVKAAAVGEAVGPIKTAQGLHFVRVTDRKPGAIPQFADVRDQIAAALREYRSKQLEQAYVSELRSRLAISINQIELAELSRALR